MNREKLEKYIGKYVEITLFDNEKITGILYKTGSERYKYEPNLYIPKNGYVLENECNRNDYSCVFKCSHIKRLNEISKKGITYGKVK